MTTVEEILEAYSPQVRELSEALRDLVKSLISHTREVAYAGWRGIGYHHPQNGYFCAIFPQADHVRLSFEHGVDLHDPDHLLEGTGKQVRYITMRDLDDLQRDAVKALILQAAG